MQAKTLTIRTFCHIKQQENGKLYKLLSSLRSARWLRFCQLNFEQKNSLTKMALISISGIVILTIHNRLGYFDAACCGSGFS